MSQNINLDMIVEQIATGTGNACSAAADKHHIDVMLR